LDEDEPTNDLDIENEDHIPQEKRKTLPNKLKRQFEVIKIKDLNNPEKLEHYQEEKFIRGKSQMARQVGDLTREISKNYKFNMNKS
jgi:hypothetical protein